MLIPIKRMAGALIAVAVVAAACSGGGLQEPAATPAPSGPGSGGGPPGVAGGSPAPAPSATVSTPAPPAPSPSAPVVPDAPSIPPAVTTPVPDTGAATASPAGNNGAHASATSVPRVPLSPVSLPKRELTFRVRVPENHPAGDRVVLMTMPPGNVAVIERVELKPDGEGFYSGTANVENGALLRYTYDRWDGQDVADWFTFRETVEDVYSFVNRYVLVNDDLDVVEDTVALWRDLPGPEHTGLATGQVLDAVTGYPVVDATVSISGVHTASDWQGHFAVENLPAGEHRAVVFTTLGDYVAQQVEFNIDELASDGLEIRLAPAKKVPVKFDVELPENTPPEAEIAISGNLWQLGARLTGYPFQPDALALPVLDRSAPGHATGTIDLYEGTYVSYTYTLRSIAEGSDRDDSGPVYRSFIVADGERSRSDAVKRWNNGDSPIITLRVKVPANTTPGVPVGIVTGPTAWMSQTGPYEWTAHLVDYRPGNEFNFGINLGADMEGRDGSPGTVDGRRTVTIPGDGSEIAIEVTKWANLPDPAARQADRSLDVTFRLSVPPETPDDAVIRLTGGRAAVIGGILMEQRSDNPWLYEATVNFAHDGDLVYAYELDGVGVADRQYRVFTEFDGQVVNDRVGAWDGLARDGSDARAGWRSGIYTPDSWSTDFIDKSDSTFARIRDVAEGGWVAVSSVWSFGALQPLPILEPRPVRIWTVLTPLEDIKAQAKQARDAGLKVFLAPQQNPEVIPGWNDPPLNIRNRQWWETWLDETEKQWMWNALAAEEIDAEMLMLPGSVFHVFPSVSEFDGDPFQQEFDARVAALVEQVRGVYGGQILISGSNREFDFPGLADVRGVTTYDLGVPSLPANASVAEWKAAYRVNFEAEVDPIRERWDGPVVFYTIHAPSTGSGSGEAPPPGDPFGEHVQANRLEAIFQLIAERPWLEGAFSWVYDYIDAPQRLSDGVRGRLGEAVQAKWYERLTGS